MNCAALFFLLLSVGYAVGLPNVPVNIDLENVIHKTNERFLSVQLGATFVQHDWKKLQICFNSPIFWTLLKALSPAYMRFGGTPQDMLFFEPDGEMTLLDIPRDSSCSFCYLLPERPPYKKFNMTGDQLDQLYHFATSTGYRFIFGLNALIRKGYYWDPNNAIKLLNYASKKGYKMDFQLGNEPHKDKFDIPLNGHDLADDFITLRKILNSYPIYKDSLLTGPDSNQPSKKSTYYMLDEVVKHAAPVLDAVTWHQYYADSKTATRNDFLSPDLLDELASVIHNASHVVGNYKSPPVMWLGETASTYGGGNEGLSDRYIAGFMWMDKLGMSAKKGLDVVIRMGIVGGHYSLINVDREGQISPNPDYWLSVLYKRLVGQRVLDVTVETYSKTVRMYAHCTNTASGEYPPGSVTLFGLNLYDDDIVLDLPSDLTHGNPVDQYILTPHISRLTSRFVELNGMKLLMVDDVTLPKMAAMPVKVARMPSRTFGFFVLPHAKAAACA